MWTIWYTSLMSLIVWPLKYVSRVEPGQHECRMSLCVILWRLTQKSMWVCAVMWLTPPTWHYRSRRCIIDSWLELSLMPVWLCCNWPSYCGGMSWRGKRWPGCFIVFLCPCISLLVTFQSAHSDGMTFGVSSRDFSWSHSEWCRCQQLPAYCSVIEGYAARIIIA